MPATNKKGLTALAPCCSRCRPGRRWLGRTRFGSAPSTAEPEIQFEKMNGNRKVFCSNKLDRFATGKQICQCGSVIATYSLYKLLLIFPGLDANPRSFCVFLSFSTIADPHLSIIIAGKVRSLSLG